ncbi:DUF6434 domain-containing protein [Citrobacter freundii]|uniref:DUF6434 domain-containing protein n=1 Tax=Citrobacter freundii TaxID=546 RepID=UPI00214D662F|nr:DUF6434 domain-containing protein [Citrobacter freundii]MCR3693353.1 DUF6434 domain-containing protein [Citrobacter freundii]
MNWHSALLTRDTVVDLSYNNTQNVRRFMKAECSKAFRFDREFIAWVRNGEPKTLGYVVNEWKQRL